MTLKVEGLVTGYGRGETLHEVDVHVDPGETVTVLGANGAGKTTLVNTISGVHPVRKGSISVEGRSVTSWRSEKRARLGVILVPEGRQLFPGLTVHENIEVAKRASKGRGDPEASLRSIFDVFPVITERWDQKAGLLSGGEQQMVALARAVASMPRYLMLDEPSLGLAPRIVDDVYALIAEIVHNTGVGVLLVEQLADRALAVAARAYLLDQGAIVLDGPAAEVAATEEVRSVYIGGHDD